MCILFVYKYNYYVCVCVWIIHMYKYVYMPFKYIHITGGGGGDDRSCGTLLFVHFNPRNPDRPYPGGMFARPPDCRRAEVLPCCPAAIVIGREFLGEKVKM